MSPATGSPAGAVTRPHPFPNTPSAGAEGYDPTTDGAEGGDPYGEAVYGGPTHHQDPGTAPSPYAQAAQPPALPKRSPRRKSMLIKSNKITDLYFDTHWFIFLRKNMPRYLIYLYCPISRFFASPYKKIPSFILSFNPLLYGTFMRIVLCHRPRDKCVKNERPKYPSSRLASAWRRLFLPAIPSATHPWGLPKSTPQGRRPTITKPLLVFVDLG